ncbi:MAG TPA: transcriptional regulator [Acidimicrobiia bacterium]|nr:transcriptional regulator [Acidimicrobiia bacterium]
MPAHDDPQMTVMEAASAAVAEGDWDGAIAAIRSIEPDRPLTPGELDVLARASYGAGDLEGAIAAYEEMHARCVATGDRLAAAGAATNVAVYLMMDTGLMAPVRAWAARADDLLEGQPETPVNAWLGIVKTYERIMSGDPDGARVAVDRAVAAAERLSAPAPAAIGRVASARLRIFEGEVEEGLKLLDEAAVAVVAGEIDPLTTGMVYCELICAMQGLAQYDRAEEWTDAMERWRHGAAFGGINGRCRVHRAEVLRLRGSCIEAEEEALKACSELRPWMRREFGWPLTELGTIRLRKGDLAGAEDAFVAAHENGWDPHPGLALLRLAQGRPDEAAALISDALERPMRVPSKERPPHGDLCRAPLLAAQVEIAVAVGALETAGQAAAEVTAIAGVFRSVALDATAALARARVALGEGDAATAAVEAEAAVSGWSDVGAPYETAVARLVLADACDELGSTERARLERQAADRAFDRIGAANAPVAMRPPTAVPAPDAHVFRVEGDTRVVAFAGETVLLKDLKGMRYLARLLAAPGREFHVLDLVAAEHAAFPVPGSHGRADAVASSATEGDAGPFVDAQAREAYRRRLLDIEDDIADAERLGDDERRALAEADREYLVRELSRAFGLGGRERTADSPSERARASVGRAVRYAMARLHEHHPAVAAHLDQALRTGTYCVYQPDPGLDIAWQT